MNRAFIEKKISIHASPDDVWRVFTDPQVSRQLGGEYITDWQPGSGLGWKSTDGRLLTQGKILRVDTARLIKHQLFNPSDNTVVISTITYRFDGDASHTMLVAREDIGYDMNDDAYETAVQGWEAALVAVKQAAESIRQ